MEISSNVGGRQPIKLEEDRVRSHATKGSLMAKILVVEDEKAHQLIIRKALDGRHEVVVADGFQHALDLLPQSNWGLFLLDIMLPDGDGFDLCSRLRADRKFDRTPVMFLTSKQNVESKVLGFRLGADDYIVKPCDPAELNARIEARLRNASKSLETMNFTEGDLTFQFDRQKVVALEGENSECHLDLTPLEFKLLYFLASHRDHAFSREQIIKEVWGEGTNVLERSVDTYVAALRRKLDTRGQYIRSVHGVGYKFTVDSRSLKSAS